MNNICVYLIRILLARLMESAFKVDPYNKKWIELCNGIHEVSALYDRLETTASIYVWVKNNFKIHLFHFQAHSLAEIWEKT